MIYYEILGYEFHPAWVPVIVEQLWDSQPLGVVSIVLTVLGIVLTLGYKVLDIFWDIYKEKSRQGRLMIELAPEINERDPKNIKPDELGELALKATLSNTGKESLVIREVGYWENRLIGGGFVAVRVPDISLPKVLQGKELVELRFFQHDFWTRQNRRFCVKDSTGHLWEAHGWQMRQVRRQLKDLKKSVPPVQTAEPESRQPMSV